MQIHNGGLWLDLKRIVHDLHQRNNTGVPSIFTRNRLYGLTRRSRPSW